MRLKQHIWILLLSLHALLTHGQILDTICVEGNHQSNLAVPFTFGVSYEWSIGGGTVISKPDSNDVLVSWGNQQGLYPMWVVPTSEHGCLGDTTKAFLYLWLPNTLAINGPDSVCAGEEVALSTQGKGAFAWQGGKTKQVLNFVANNDTSVYLVNFNAPCKNDTVFHHIYMKSGPKVNFTGPNNDSIAINATHDFFAHVTGGQDFVWYVNGEIMSKDQLLIHQFNKVGEVEVTLQASNGTCSDLMVGKYYVFDDFKVHIPNAFSANSDGVNDRFLFKGVGMKSYRAQVYTRWGERIFTWTNNSETPGWDGTMKNGNKATIGVYLYKIYVTDLYGVEHIYQGNFTLLR